MQVLRRLYRRQKISAAQAQHALRLLNALLVNRFEHQAVCERIWSMHDNLTAYDAAYSSLAEVLDAPLWTCDRKFAAVPGHKVIVEML